MIKLLLAAMLLFSPMVFAVEKADHVSGWWKNSAKTGTGLIVLRRDNRVVFANWTYGQRSCHLPDLPGFYVPIPYLERNYYRYDCGIDNTRWFFGADTFDEADKEVSGFLYTGQGINFPDGIPDPSDPFRDIVGTGVIVGIYILKPHHDGWRLVVVRVGDYLDEDDVLFSEIWEYDFKLFNTD
jgi:hypothetical protein